MLLGVSFFTVCGFIFISFVFGLSLMNYNYDIVTSLREIGRETVVFYGGYIYSFLCFGVTFTSSSVPSLGITISSSSSGNAYRSP